MSTKTVYVVTDSAGDFAYERPMSATIRGVSIELGTLDTPDITVSDGIWGTVFLDLPALAADAAFQPAASVQGADGTTLVGTYAQPAVLGSLRVDVANGGAVTHGRIHLLLET